MSLKDKKILTIVSKDYDDLEFHYPILRLQEEGVEIVIASEAKGETIQGKYGLSTKSDVSFDEVNISEFDGFLHLPLKCK